MFQNSQTWNYFESTKDDPIYDSFDTLNHEDLWENYEEIPVKISGWLESMMGKWWNIIEICKPNRFNLYYI